MNQKMNPYKKMIRHTEMVDDMQTLEELSISEQINGFKNTKKTVSKIFEMVESGDDNDNDLFSE